jgi:UDP-glucuronate 4-epimerase
MGSGTAWGDRIGGQGHRWREARRRDRRSDAAPHGLARESSRRASERACARIGRRMNNLRAIVTGAAGFIGSHLTQALLAAGNEVVGIDCFTPYYSTAAKRQNLAQVCDHPDFRLVSADLTELVFEEVLAPGDVVFHLAAQPGVRSSWGAGFIHYLRNNVQATQRVLEAAVRCGVSRVVYASSSSVYGNAPVPMSEDSPLRPLSPYGVTKLAGEELCFTYWREFQLPVVPLRLFSVYGPRQRPDMAFSSFISSIVTRRPVSIRGDGQQRRDFTYVSDVVAALQIAAGRAEPGVALNVARGTAVSILEAVAILERLLNRDAHLEWHAAISYEARETLGDTARLDSFGAPASVPWGRRRRTSECRSGIAGEQHQGCRGGSG